MDKTLCYCISVAESKEDQVEDYAIPLFYRPLLWNFQNVGWVTYRQLFMNSSNSFKHLEKQMLLTTTLIPTTGPPVHVPPRCIPIHYCEEVLKQLKNMLDQGIIKQSNSSWMAPAVFVRTKSGELCILDCLKITDHSTREHQGMHTHSLYLIKYKISWMSQPFFNFRFAMWVLATSSLPRRPGEDFLLSWTRYGFV